MPVLTGKGPRWLPCLVPKRARPRKADSWTVSPSCLLLLFFPTPTPKRAACLAMFESAEFRAQWCNRSAESPAMLGWVPEPDYRSTVGIIWTCVLVTFTCTWTVMHINVPGPRETWKDVFMRKMRWALFILYAPEAVTLLAACQWQSACESVAKMREIGVEQWTKTHGFFADSGGFVLDSTDEGRFPIDARALYYLVANGYIRAPETTEAEIIDRSKSDHFVKATAIIQMTYLFTQVIARAAQNLETSCLEIVTVAFCLCALATSAFWLKKPKDVVVPIVIPIKTPLSQVLHEAGVSAEWSDTPMDFTIHPGTWTRRDAFRTFGGLHERPMQRIPNDRIPPPTTLRLALFTWFINVLHPAVHMLKWHFAFPTLIDKYVWQTSSACLLAVLFSWGIVEVLTVKPGLDCTMTLLGIWVHETRSESWWRRYLIDFMGTCSSLLYLVARTALIVETVLSLRKMPSSVYQTVEWPQYLPHVG